MDALKIINAILRNFGNSIGLTDLILKDNKVSLSFDDALIVNMKYQAEQELLTFEAQISVSETLDDPLLRALLAFNYHWAEHQLFFGLNLDTQHLCLYQHVDISQIDYDQFEMVLAEIVSQAEKWAELLNLEDETALLEQQPHSTNISGIRV
ncbi:CesT family type III secretion system chaperone [Shewanella sp. VB17]|uniref:CesT family type III secretion system chaperone n=1 Tax=Shewanella sp. VB17 TaxID=2739432 RepID=UPI0015671DC2|nr:CesT family type III secretion system chaperone [Shewanella sp. VB17]NRD71742.1 CesT family type III secretion system chaperone [Shewanella sp. VB17]